MNIFARTAIGMISLSCLTLAAETIDLSMPNTWEQNKKLGWNDGTITTKGRIKLSTLKKFPVDPSKKYSFSFMAKSSGPNNWMLAGFQAYDAKGRLILSPNVNAVPGSMTQVVNAAAKGARVIFVKNAEKWGKRGGFSIVTGAKADFSDLPNFNIAATGIADVKQEGKNWKVTLTKPLAKPLAAGTSVRLHLPNGALYSCGITYISNKWHKMSGSIRGVLKKPGYNYKTWPIGTAYGQAIILVNWKNVKDLATELENLKLEIE